MICKNTWMRIFLLKTEFLELKNNVINDLSGYTKNNINGSTVLIKNLTIYNPSHKLLRPVRKMVLFRLATSNVKLLLETIWLA